MRSKSLIISGILISLLGALESSERAIGSDSNNPVSQTVESSLKSTPNALADEVAAMSRMGKCNFPSFSPDDRTICFISDLSGSPQLWTVPITGGWPTQITAIDGPVIGEQWSPKTEWIAFLAGNCDRNIEIVRADGTGHRSFSDTGSLSDWTSDGKKIICSVSGEGKDSGPTLFNPATGTRERVGDKSDCLVDLSADGRFAISNRYVSNFESNLYLYDRQKHTETLITPHSGNAHSGGGWCNRSRARFEPDGSRVFLVTNIGRKLNGFAQIKVNPEGQASPVEYISKRDDAQLIGFAMNDDATRAALVWQGASKDPITLVDLKTGQSQSLPEPPHGSVGEISISHHGQSLAVSLFRGMEPDDVFVLAQGEKSWKQLTHSQHPGVNLAKIAPTEYVSFKSAQGITRQGRMWRPKNEKGAVPFVIYFGGWSNEGAEREALVERGIGVFSPQDKEDIGAVANFTDKGSEAEGRLQRVKDCVDYLVASGIADRKRIGITGQSQFGYQSLAAITSFPDSFAACVERSGWVDFATQMQHTSSGWAKFLHAEYGSPQDGSAVMDLLSPVHRLDQAKAAIMVQHGALDNNVPVEEAQQVIDYFQKHGKPVESLILPDEGHVFMKSANQVKSTVALVEFFVKHLRPETNSPTAIVPSGKSL